MLDSLNDRVLSQPLRMLRSRKNANSLTSGRHLTSMQGYISLNVQRAEELSNRAN